MSDNLVKRLRICAAFDPDQAEAADCIEKLQAANLQQSIITVDHLSRIEKLEAALIDILKVPRSEASWGIALVIARKALEGKDD